MTDEAENTSSKVSRRDWMARGALLLSGGALAALFGPALRFVAFPAETNTTEAPRGFLPAGSTARYRPGVPIRVALKGTIKDAWTHRSDVEVGSAWVTRGENDQFQVLSTICPHLGCAISHESTHFLCPCHGSYFSEAGERQEPDGKPNPSPRGMDPLEWKVEDNQLWIKYERFEQGTDKRLSLTRKQEA